VQVPYPANVAITAIWTFDAVTNVTSARMIVTNLKSAQWAAIGIGLNDSMGENHVFICKRLANDTIVVNRYINPHEHHEPVPAGDEQGGTFTPGQQQFDEGVVICRFTLSKFATQTLAQPNAILPLSQSTPYHPKFAVGILDDTSEPQQHNYTARLPLSIFVQLNTSEIILYKMNNTDGVSYDGTSRDIIGYNGATRYLWSLYLLLVCAFIRVIV
jgi:hypothetical protein